jgi:hypothetical protein
VIKLFSTTLINASIVAFSATLAHPGWAADPKKVNATEWFSERGYSNMGFNKELGETYGLEISIVPYSGGEKVLWRSAEGSLDEPILVDGLEENSEILVKVPDRSGRIVEWKIKERGSYATVSSLNDTFTLKSVSGRMQAKVKKVERQR